MISKICAAIALVWLGYTAHGYMKDPVPPLYEIRALTTDGHLFVLGRGDTCEDALKGIRELWRDNWLRVACEANS